MVDYTLKYAPIVQRAIEAYNGLIALYEQEDANDRYFKSSLAQAKTKRNGLEERLTDPKSLAGIFKDNYVLSIDHFLDSHRGEYGPNMPGSNLEKASLADNYLQELRQAMQNIIEVGSAQGKEV